MKSKKQTTPKLRQPTNQFVIKDNDGNAIISAHHGSFCIVRLRLAEENFQREIGTIVFDKREMRVKRQRGKHLLKKANAYGFNHYILNNAKLFDFVVIEDEYTSWRIPREVMIKDGQFLHFKNSGGFELQIFVSLETLAPYALGVTATPPL